MKTNSLLCLVIIGSSVIKIASAVVTSCAGSMCICDDEQLTASCRPDRGREELLFFPRLPNFVTDVMFKDYTRRHISTKDLVNLTRLRLEVLRLHSMEITTMEMGLFQSFKSLKIIDISYNPELSSDTLKEAFRNISQGFQTFNMTSSRLDTVPDMFKYLVDTNFTSLVLAYNPLYHFKADVVKGLHLKILDLSYSEFGNLTIICPAISTPLLPTLENLQLRSTKIKTLPKNVLSCFPSLQKVNFDNTPFGFFPTFCHNYQHVTNHLETLYLANTRISGHICSKHFLCLKNLRHIKLDKNPITNFPHFCNSKGFSNVPKLYRLRLQFTSITIFHNDSLKCLPSLKSLDLKNNLFKSLPTFCRENNTSYTPKLKELFLQNTSITNLKGFKFGCLPNLEKLDLRYNFFRQVPSFCDGSNHSTNPLLHDLNLSNTKIKYIFNDSFLCLPSLRKLYLKNTEITRLDDNIFSSLGSLTYLEIGDSPSLTGISKYAFNIASLLTMKFTYNNFDFERKKYFPKYLFKSCANVTTLDLSGNHFSTGPTAEETLKPLTKLVTLILTNNRMDTIHEYTFRSSKTLKEIHLNQNKLIGWKKNVFQNLSNLQHLNMADNKIAVFNKTSVPTNILNHLTTLNLAYNPFDCGCDLIWFKKWSLQTNVTLLLFPNKYSCQTPASMLRQPITSLQLTKDDCTEKHPWIIYIAAASAGSFLLFLTFTLITVQLPTIKNYIYYFRLKRIGYVKLINDQDYRYDAYVVYCEADEKWVIRTLVPKLESEGLQLCIPDREFRVGADRCGEIESAFQESKKILVILSNDFAKNEWCLWQEHLVEERLRQRGNSSVVFVLYKNISSKNMISSLHRTMKNQSIVTWHEGGAREKMFWKVVILAVQSPLGEPPVSVLNG